MSDLLKLIVNQLIENGPQSGAGWRRDPKYFGPQANSEVPLDVPVLSPAWFPQGHNVRCKLVTWLNYRLMSFQRRQDIVTSSTLTGKYKESGLAFLAETEETNALISGILSVIHQDQWALGMFLTCDLSSEPRLSDALCLWQSPFTALQVVNNRASPPHKDPGSAYTAMDVCAMAGDFEEGTLHFCDLKLTLPQNPGTVVAFLGRALTHEVGGWMGDRVLWVWFQRDGVAKAFDEPQPQWCYYNALRAKLG